MRSGIFALVGLALIAGACSPKPGTDASGLTTGSPGAATVAQDGSEFLGVWSNNFQPDMFPDETYQNFVNIEKNGSTFLVRISTNSKRPGYGMSQGVFPATYQNGILQTSDQTIGGIAFSASENSIFVKGRPLLKVVQPQ